MKIKYPRYIKYSTLKGITVYTGDYLGCGLTLSPVIQLIKMYKENKDIQIVTNISLYNIPYEKFDIHKLYSYKDKVIFIDMAELVLNSRRHASSVITYFRIYLPNLLKLNNKIILSTRNINWLDSGIRVYYKNIIRCNYHLNKNKTPCLRIIKYDINNKNECSMYPVIKCKKYLKYYNTYEIIKEQPNETRNS